MDEIWESFGHRTGRENDSLCFLRALHSFARATSPRLRNHAALRNELRGHAPGAFANKAAPLHVFSLLSAAAAVASHGHQVRFQLREGSAALIRACGGCSYGACNLVDDDCGSLLRVSRRRRQRRRRQHQPSCRHWLAYTAGTGGVLPRGLRPRLARATASRAALAMDGHRAAHATVH